MQVLGQKFLFLLTMSQSGLTAAITRELRGPYSSFTDRSKALAHKGVTSHYVPFLTTLAQHVHVCEIFFISRARKRVRKST